MATKISPQAKARREIARCKAALIARTKEEREAWRAYQRADAAESKAYAAYQRKNGRRAQAEVDLGEAEAWLKRITQKIEETKR
jgi:succinate dehydrogenase/fumarate reductase flavoprotein subunit